MDLKRSFTKSLFKIATECPRKLFYAGKSAYRDASKDDAFLQSLADGGFQVGALAKCLYAGGVEIEATGNAEALALTADQMRAENVTLFEPAIAYGDFLVRIDVLIKTGKSIKLVEVKSKAYRSDDPQIVGRSGSLKSGFKPYIEDIAFQTFVVRQAYPDCSVTSFLLMPDKSRVSSVDKMNQLFKIERHDGRAHVIPNPTTNTLTFDTSLLCEVNVDKYIARVHDQGISYPRGQGSLADMAAIWAKAYKEDRPLPPIIGAQCGACQFKAKPNDALKSGFDECWKEANGWSDIEVKEPTVIDLWKFRDKQKLIERGTIKLSEINRDDLGFDSSDHGLSNAERQWLQIQWASDSISQNIEHKAAGFFFDRNYMATEMKGWRYPLHFIDFETSAVALPFHVGMRPYENVAFQFSHHVLEQDGSLRHETQFLQADVGAFPNYEFARALRDALSGDTGSVFMWASHENTILAHIVEQLRARDDAPTDKIDLATFLQTLIKGGDRAMIDLRTLAQKGYFHPSTKGSNSIKKVLPAVLDSSAYLRERYAQPIYGVAGGIRSLNFRDMVWWTQDQNGRVEDPYKKLTNEDVVGRLNNDSGDDDINIIGGGEATMAYGRMQFEALNEETRADLKAKLLRYCELDTLAMAMIVEAWKAHLADFGNKKHSSN